MNYSKFKKRKKYKKRSHVKRKKYNKRTRVKRKNYNKKMSGGGRVYNPSVFVSIERIYPECLEKNFEICGYGESLTDGSNKIQLFVVAEGDPKVGNNPASCNTRVNYPIVWHTHPTVSKMYPSLIDLFKIIKYSSHTSIIFTIHGYWVMRLDGSIADFDDSDSSFFVKLINTHLTTFYESTGGGRVYNKTAINTFVHNINTSMGTYVHHTGQGGNLLSSYTIRWIDITHPESRRYFL